MKAFFALKLLGFFLFTAVLTACSSMQQMDYYGYEENFEIPEPQIIQSTSSEGLGRSVDDMLGFSRQQVTIKKATLKKEEQEDVKQDYEGRFGSKEKKGLRKGLNAPMVKVLYSEDKRLEEKNVRALELNPKQKRASVQQEEKPPVVETVEEVKAVEVIAIVPEKEEKEEEKEQAFLAQIVAPKKIENQEEIALPVVQKQEEKAQKYVEEETIVLIPLKEEEESDVVFLIAPEEEIILIPPQENQSEYRFDETMFIQ